MFDKRMFLSQAIADANSNVMTMYFVMNKKLDNLMDYLDIELDMANFSTQIHHLAHRFPLLADDFRDYNALYNYRTKYYGVPNQYVDFTDLEEAIKSILDYLAEMDIALANAREVGTSEQNYDYTHFTDQQIGKLREYKGIFMMLDSKIDAYRKEGNSNQDIDARVSTFLEVE